MLIHNILHAIHYYDIHVSVFRSKNAICKFFGIPSLITVYKQEVHRPHRSPKKHFLAINVMIKTSTLA